MASRRLLHGRLVFIFLLALTRQALAELYRLG